jgi:hypothetical protein
MSGEVSFIRESDEGTEEFNDNVFGTYPNCLPVSSCYRS